MAGKKISDLTEVLTVDTENDYVVIARSGDNKKLKVANMMGSTNVGENYVDLLGEDGTTEYRLIIDQNGKVQVFPKECITGHKYEPGDNLKKPLKSDKVVVGAVGAKSGDGEKNASVVDVHGIVINQAFGGDGYSATDMKQGTACSHSFVELYNCSNNLDVNLCGLYLHYRGFGSTGTLDTAWKTLPLRGLVPPRTSFLIRGKQHAPFYSDMVNCKLYDYDQEWIDEATNEPLAFSSKGFAFYLSTNSKPPTINPEAVTVIKNDAGVITSTTYDQYYVDLLGCGGAGVDTAPPAYNKFFWNCLNKDTGVRRINFRNNKNNKYDTEPINYRTCEKLEDIKPRSLRDGLWEQIEDKIKPNLNAPNLINITFGKVATTRYFTWQSIMTNSGYVKYRKIKNESNAAEISAWKQVESEREIVNNHNIFMTIHRVKLTDLEPGLYEYKCGEEGYWSDIEQMEIRKYDDNSTIKILWTTDQQGYTEQEYKAWDSCVKAIREQNGVYNDNGLPVFDFHLNTGDISQNASNLYEWLYYSKYAGEFCKNIPHMITCGNNDLVEKNYGFAFEHYSTYEDVPMLNSIAGTTVSTVDCPMVSTYSFDIGNVHFVSLNSNQELMYNDYGINAAIFLDKQARFLDKDLWEVCQRQTKPKWIIVLAHLSPFTVTRAKRLQHWIAVVEHYEVDLFLCGHNHTYSRSIPIKCGYEKTKYEDAISEKNYNTYVTKAATYTEVAETKKDNQTEIDRTANPTHGTYYVMFQAGGAKQSGKEKAIDITVPAFTGLNSKHKSINAPNRPWWYDYNGALPVQPCYSTIDITKDAITMKMNYVKDVESIAKDTGIISISNYNSAKNTVVNFDNLTINYADRQPAYRTGGVTAPYYDENK